MRLSLGLCLAMVSHLAVAQSLRGSLETGAEVFTQAPAFTSQSDAAVQPYVKLRLQGAAELGPETELVLNSRAVATIFADQKIFGDASEAFLEHRMGRYSIRAGMLDERWGFLDAKNPANIFNALDIVEDYQGDVRLGQPGAAFRFVGDSLGFTLLASPMAREQRTPDGRDRLRLTGLPLRNARFENGRWTPSVAARVNLNLENLELAVSHFHGTSREAEFRFDPDAEGPALRPYYRRIDQSALEAQYVLGDYVLRGELIRRQGQTGRSFFGLGVGLERIFYGAFGGTEDLQVYAEAYYDDRPNTAPVTAFQRDISVGGRLIMNNEGSTEFAARSTVDLEGGGSILEFGAAHRVWSDYVLGFNATVPLGGRSDPALAAYRRDTRLRFALTRYF